MNIREAKKILKGISFAPSCVDMGWKFEIKKTTGGFLIRTSFRRPDTNTGKIGTGYGRWMFVSKDAGERDVVMTAWLCAELIVKHELMESFLYLRVRILNPHKSIEDLAHPEKLK